MRRAWMVMAGLSLAGLVLLGPPAPAMKAASTPAADEPAANPGARLEADCANCHAGAVSGFHDTIHGRWFREHPRGALERSDCAACHGPLDAHAADPDDRAAIRSLRRGGGLGAVERSAPCLSCHATDPALFSADHSRHQKAGVACADCHTVMKPTAMRGLIAAADANALCASCHPGVAMQARLRTTHVPDGGAIRCLDCHNPHGATRGALARETVNETCAPCHRAQAGPFLFEHAPVEENCMNCHSPHGAPQPALLKLNTASLCLSCHSQAPFFHSFTGMDRFTLAKSCANCHSQIHGSNHADGSRLQR